jgi:hypothetical protein
VKNSFDEGSKMHMFAPNSMVIVIDECKKIDKASVRVGLSIKLNILGLEWFIVILPFALHYDESSVIATFIINKLTPLTLISPLRPLQHRAAHTAERRLKLDVPISKNISKSGASLWKRMFSQGLSTNGVCNQNL